MQNGQNMEIKTIMQTTDIAELLNYINNLIVSKLQDQDVKNANLFLTQEDLESYFNTNIEKITNQELDAIFNS